MKASSVNSFRFRFCSESGWRLWLEKRVFQLRFRASELLYVREGRQALVDRKPFSQSDLEKTNHFLF